MAQLSRICFGLWLMVSSCAPAETTQRDAFSEPATTSAPAERALFNGHDLDDWMVKIHHHAVGENYGNTFRAEDGMIKVRYDAYGDFDEQFGHLYYRQPYAYFHLKLEYRFVGELQRGAPEFTRLNSGLMFHAQDPRTMPKEQNWPISVEMQFLAGLGDGQPRPTGNMCSPGTNVIYQGKRTDEHCINSTSPTFEGEQWVRAELLVVGDSLITHLINGDTVLQYAYPQVHRTGVVRGDDREAMPEGSALSEGYIALQSEGQPIDFRNITLLDLSDRYRSTSRANE